MSDDELKNKSGKVKVMYVRSDDDSDRRTHNPRTGKGGGRPGKSRVDGRNRPARDEKESRGGDRKRDDRKREGFGGEGSSPYMIFICSCFLHRHKKETTLVDVVSFLLSVSRS